MTIRNKELQLEPLRPEFSLSETLTGSCETAELIKYVSFAKKYFFNLIFSLHFTSRYFACILAELHFCEALGRDSSPGGDWEGG